MLFFHDIHAIFAVITDKFTDKFYGNTYNLHKRKNKKEWNISGVYSTVSPYQKGIYQHGTVCSEKACGRIV
jgi:hypothetical protein